MIRDQLLPINGWLFSQMRAAAELQDIPPEALIELWLRERLDTMPEIAELAAMRAEARKAADLAWKKKWIKS